MAEDIAPPPWLDQYCQRLSGEFARTTGDALAITPDRGAIMAPGATEQQYSAAFERLSNTRNTTRIVQVHMDRMVGQLICSYAAERDIDWTTAISQLNLTVKTGKALKTLVKLPRIVSVLPESIWLRCPNLAIGHFDAATSFAAPQDVEGAISFAAAREQLLIEANENPASGGKSAIARRMRKIQEAHGVLPCRRESISDIRDKMMAASIVLLEWEPEHFESHGTTKESVLSMWTQWKEQLDERGHVDADIFADDYRLPWEGAAPQTHDVEADVIPPEEVGGEDDEEQE